jgi:hypothetical protein
MKLHQARSGPHGSVTTLVTSVVSLDIGLNRERHRPVSVRAGKVRSQKTPAGRHRPLLPGMGCAREPERRATSIQPIAPSNDVVRRFAEKVRWYEPHPAQARLGDEHVGASAVQSGCLVHAKRWGTPSPKRRGL